MDDYTIIGKVLKPQALKGEIRVGPITRDATQYLTYDYLYVGEDFEKYDIDYCRLQDGFVIVKFTSINDANLAETLRNKMLYVDKSQLGELEQGEYYIQDLIGCKVLDSKGMNQGIVTAIDDFSSVSTVTIKIDGKELMFPFLERVILDVNVEEKTILVDKESFMEVLIDEN